MDSLTIGLLNYLNIVPLVQERANNYSKDHFSTALNRERRRGWRDISNTKLNFSKSLREIYNHLSHNGLFVIKAANGTSPSDWLEHKDIVTNMQLIVSFPSMHFKSSHQHIQTGEVVSITH